MTLLNWVFIFWAFFQCVIVSVTYANSKIQFIKDLCVHENRPTVIYGFLCWNPGLRTVQGILVENVDTNKLFYPLPPHRALFIVDLHCDGTEMFLQQADQLGLFISPYRWLLFSGKNSINNDTNIDPESMNTLNLLGVYLDSNVIFVQSLKNHENIEFEIFQPYKITENMSIILENYGQWTKNYTLIDKRVTSIISRRRRNFHQATSLRVGVAVYDNRTLTELGTYKTPHVDALSKSNVIITQIILEYFNCTVKYVFSDLLGGPVYHPSQAKGVFKLVLDKKIDIGSSYLISSVRLVAKFITPSSDIQSKIIFRRPRLSYIENLFTLTFAGSTWIAIAILTLVTIILLAVTTFIEEKYQVYDKIIFSASVNYLHSKLSDIILVMVATVTQQGTETEPRSNAGKIILFILLLSLTFLYNAYTALIVVILQSSSDSIQTIIDIANSKLVFGADEVYFKPYFINISYPERLYLYNKKLKNVPENEIFMPIQEGVRRLRNESFAYLTLPSIAYHLIEKDFYEHEKCDIHEISFVQSTHGWLVTYLNSSYIENFKVAYQTLYETGHTKRVFRRFYLQKPYCANAQNYFTSAGFEDLNFAFKLFTVGITVAVGIFVYEHIRYRMKKRRALNVTRNKNQLWH